MKRKKAAFIILDAWERMYPLVAANLAGYACTDPEIRENWEFECVVNRNTISPATLESEMDRVKADVYAFICYIWNMGLVKRVMWRYAEKRPDAGIILGGPQVAHQGERYLDRDHENLVICDGEGERTFRAYLRAMMTDSPDLGEVAGLTFHKEKRLITTPSPPRIENLDEIPSPFSHEWFEKGDFEATCMETNRGCPFHCKYCYWGSHLDSKLVKFSDDRVKSDIEKISLKKIEYLELTDSNFGIFPRDLEIASQIAVCRMEHGHPSKINFATHIDRKRVTAIFKTLHEAGFRPLFEIPLQTMTSDVRREIARKQPLENYVAMIGWLNESRIPYYTENIWPLPTETLKSFRRSIARQCELNVNFMLFYPLVLMNNITLQDEREKYGLVTESSKDTGSEAEIVVQTKDVSYEECLEGWRLLFATTVLHCFKSLCLTAAHLNASGLERYEGLLSKFSEFSRSQADMPGYSALKMITDERSEEFRFYYTVRYEIYHAQRELFDLKLFEFVSSHPWWENDSVQRRFEVDMLNRPCLHKGEMREKTFEFQHLRIVETLPDGYVVEIPLAHISEVREMLGCKASFESQTVKVDYFKDQSSEESEDFWEALEITANGFKSLPEWKDYRQRR